MKALSACSSATRSVDRGEMVSLGRSLRRPAALFAPVSLGLVLAVSGLIVGCSAAEPPSALVAPGSASGSVPAEPEILAAAVQLSGTSSAKASNPETIACPKASEQGWSAYEVELAGGDGSRLFIKYEDGEWTRLDAAAPCLACHADDDSSSQPSY
ncbi:MAG: hypothetical protein KJ747_00485 [Actinobacteria bacterium]|nr:hypothetical protein [Actinomycetota bacterium]